MNPVTIYHNPGCSKSRQTLELLTNEGIEPEVILYLEDTPSTDALKSLIEKLGISARDLLRTGEAQFKDLGLDDVELSDQTLIEAMAGTPILIQRPIVECGDKARIGRPPEQVLEIIS